MSVIAGRHADPRTPAWVNGLPVLPGFEAVERPPYTILVQSAWKDVLVDDLADDWKGGRVVERRLHDGGRRTHFSYLPRGANGRVFVRRVVRGGVLGRLFGELQASPRRVVQELVASEAGCRSGVPVVRPIAVRARRTFGLWRFVVVTPELPGARSLTAALRDLSGAFRRRLALRVADLVRQLHDAGIFPRDLTLDNILMSGGDLQFVDFDRACLGPRADRAMSESNLVRLARSSEKRLGDGRRVSTTEGFRFLRRYFGGASAAKAFWRKAGRRLWRHRLWWTLAGRSSRI